ncbi:uncharacterized protein B0T15DRAFT_513522 [Chaetomium strumarium]|uniref:Uncharacterized protein n=1 Tax=Chaetomium strumarium TaxID=1170767 RepID=A0AAJ0GNP0_9PEZI|nr:hypothetical protein B0T15DRAFT_513522 [Chaetomium strumarium]
MGTEYTPYGYCCRHHLGFRAFFNRWPLCVLAAATKRRMSMLLLNGNPWPRFSQYLQQNTGSRPLSLSQATKGRTSTQVGDHWGILGVRREPIPRRYDGSGVVNVVLANDFYIFHEISACKANVAASAKHIVS